MNPIESIKLKLKKYPDVKYDVEVGYIKVLPNNTDGFSVSMYVNPNHIEVYFDDGWHETFREADEALDCFSFGLSEDCRLKITTRGNRRYKWEVQSLKSGNWEVDSETGLLLFPFWRKVTVSYLQNKLFKSLNRS